MWTKEAIFYDFLAFFFLSWENEVLVNEKVEKPTVLRRFTFMQIKAT